MSNQTRTTDHVNQCSWEPVKIELYNEELCKDLEYSKNLPTQAAFREAETRLSDFYKRLKSFIVESLFDVHGFEAQGQKLQKEITELGHNVTSTAYCDEGISQQLAHVQKVFQIMAESIEALKYYESVESPGHHFMCSVIDLNVTLLTLKSSFGGPDFSVKDLEPKVRSLKQYWTLLKVGFDNHGPNSFGKQMKFDSHYCQAERTLQDLERYVAEYNSFA